MQKFQIDLMGDLKEEIKTCVNKVEDNLSPTGAKLYICSSPLFESSVRENKKKKFIDNIVKTILCWKNLNTILEIEISIEPAPVQKRQPKM